ncbi:MAG: polysaccharide deacetylase [Gorillibacterium sp.]|nr:polysaccharide deacetylase [Gorillibacterium sp.]
MKELARRFRKYNFHRYQAALLAAILLLLGAFNPGTILAAGEQTASDTRAFQADATTASVEITEATINKATFTAAASSDAEQLRLEGIYALLQTGKRIKEASTSIVVQASSTKQTPKPTVYLTFDDGPSKLTPQVLDILKKQKVKATFFMLGEQMESRSDTVKRVVEEGHALGNHTYNHVYKELYSSFDAFWNQIEKTDSILRKITGSGSTLLRAPGGSYTNFDAFYYYLLDAAGYKVIDWNVDSKDATRRNVPASEIIAAVTNAPLKNQMVVLLHDGGGHEQTVKALPRIIEYFQAQGYEFSAMQEDRPVVQFPVGKIKWKRALSYSDFSRLLGKAGQKLGEIKQIKLADIKLKSLTNQARSEQGYNATTQAKSEQGIEPIEIGSAGESRNKASVNVKKSAAPKTLQVIVNGKPWELHEGQYSIVSGRFMVPVEGLAAQLHALVKPDKLEQRVEICLGLNRVSFDYPSHTIQITAPGKVLEKRPLVRMLAQSEGIHVSLRTAVELLGGRVTRYSVAGSSGVVEIECHPKTSLLSPILSPADV